FSAAQSRRDVSKRTDRIRFPYGIPGGLWHTDTPELQEPVLAVQLYKLIFTLAKRDIPTTLMNFPKTTRDPDYLYKKIEFILGGMYFDSFLSTLREVVKPQLFHEFTRKAA